jgi:plasmid maintenance system killer protein
MIENFADKRTEKLFEGSLRKGFPQDLINRAITKLVPESVTS